MFEDILHSAKVNLVDRLNSPLIGAFTVSWCAWNWKFLVILFSDASVSTTFALVDQVAFSDWKAIIFRGAVFPLLTALAYVFLYPYPARYVYEFTLRRQQETNAIRKKLDDETPLTLEESRKLRLAFVENERRNTENVQRLSEEIARLKDALEDALDSRDAVKPTVALTNELSNPNSISSDQIHILRLLADAGGEMLQQRLISESSQSKIKAEFNLGELEGHKLIARRRNIRDGSVKVSFTQEGRRALLSAQETEPTAG